MSDELQTERHNHLKELFGRLEDTVNKQAQRIDRMEFMRKIERVAWILIGVWLSTNPAVVPVIQRLTQ